MVGEEMRPALDGRVDEESKEEGKKSGEDDGSSLASSDLVGSLDLLVLYSYFGYSW
jgi:hypothetical protein